MTQNDDYGRSGASVAGPFSCTTARAKTPVSVRIASGFAAGRFAPGASTTGGGLGHRPSNDPPTLNTSLARHGAFSLRRSPPLETNPASSHPQAGPREASERTPPSTPGRSPPRSTSCRPLLRRSSFPLCTPQNVGRTSSQSLARPSPIKTSGRLGFLAGIASVTRIALGGRGATSPLPVNNLLKIHN